MSKIPKKLKLPALDAICNDSKSCFAYPTIGVKYQEYRGRKCFIATDGRVFACFDARSLNIEVECAGDKVIPREAWTKFRKAKRVILQEGNMYILYSDGREEYVSYLKNEVKLWAGSRSLLIKEDKTIFDSDKIFSEGIMTSFFNAETFYIASKVLCFDKVHKEVMHYSCPENPNLLLCQDATDRFVVVMPCKKTDVKYMESADFISKVLREDKIPF